MNLALCTGFTRRYRAARIATACRIRIVMSPAAIDCSQPRSNVSTALGTAQIDVHEGGFLTFVARALFSGQSRGSGRTSLEATDGSIIDRMGGKRTFAAFALRRRITGQSSHWQVRKDGLSGELKCLQLCIDQSVGKPTPVKVYFLLEHSAMRGLGRDFGTGNAQRTRRWPDALEQSTVFKRSNGLAYGVRLH